MIYLPVETSGEGEINAHSRVQMALGEAKNKAKKEFAGALEARRPDAGRVPRVRGRASRNEAAHVPGAAHQGRGRQRGEFRVCTSRTRMRKEGALPNRSHGVAV